MQNREIGETLRSAASLPIDEGLRAVIRLAMTAGDWTAGSIMAVTPAGSLRTVSYAGYRGIDCDRWQLELGRGPAYDAAQGGSIQFAGDLRQESRWGRWPDFTVAIGIISTLSVRLHTVTTLGSLNLYSDRPRAAGGGVFDCAATVAAHASVFLSHFNAERQFLTAINAGTVIGQAQGILMQKYHLTKDQALALLRSLSEQNDIDVAELASHLIDTGDLT